MIASKTFTTQETMTNAHTARDWFLQQAGDPQQVAKHFVAISTNQQGGGGLRDSPRQHVRLLGLGRRPLFPLVRHRSIHCLLTSALTTLWNFLAGAHEMDRHFRETPFAKNIPVFWPCWASGIPISSEPKLKSSCLMTNICTAFRPTFNRATWRATANPWTATAGRVTYQTGPIIWGEPGTNGQHAFYQLIHQGTKLIPADFLAPAISHNPIGQHHQILLSNFFAQTEALMLGKTKAEVLAELQKAGKSQEYIDTYWRHRVFEGNRPTTSILFKMLTPRVLGSLIAMYEHKIFVQGVIWNIFSFDQWGVELGKQLAKRILPELDDDRPVATHDASTNGLINAFKKMRQ